VVNSKLAIKQEIEESADERNDPRFQELAGEKKP
jgi:hypothetical protein